MSTSDTSSRPSAKFVLVITANIDGSPSYSDGYIFWSHSSDLERFVFNSFEEAKASAATNEFWRLDVVRLDRKLCKIISTMRNPPMKGCYVDGRVRG